MMKIQLIHWNDAEAEERAVFLRQAGYEVDTTKPNGPPFLRRLGENPPDAVLIDLTRIPSHGREVGVSIRMRKSTRQIPLVFLAGEPDKVARISHILPDAIYSDWDTVLPSLEKIYAEATGEVDTLSGSVVVPQSVFEAYADTPLVKKLGIKAGAKVGYVDAPDDFRDLLIDLPEGVTLVEGIQPGCELIIWFVGTRRALETKIAEKVAQLGRSSIWIAWPKKTSSLASDLTQQEVRETGMANQLVDYKICSIDETWSGLLFTIRK